MPIVTLAAQRHFFISGEIGFSKINFTKSKPTITYYNDLLTDSYPRSKKNYDPKAELALQFGYDIYTGKKFIPSVALSVGVYKNMGANLIKGTVHEMPSGGPSFVLYNYQFRNRNLRVMFDAQLSWLLKQHIFPFVDAGIGPSWNKNYRYMETAVASDGFVSVPPFQSKMNTNLGYQLGFGVGYIINQESFSLGYRYVNYGDSRFRTRGEVYPYALKLGDLYTDGIYFSYTHHFG